MWEKFDAGKHTIVPGSLVMNVRTRYPSFAVASSDQGARWTMMSIADSQTFQLRLGDITGIYSLPVVFKKIPYDSINVGDKIGIPALTPEGEYHFMKDLEVREKGNDWGGSDFLRVLTNRDLHMGTNMVYAHNKVFYVPEELPEYGKNFSKRVGHVARDAQHLSLDLVGAFDRIRVARNSTAVLSSLSGFGEKHYVRFTTRAGARTLISENRTIEIRLNSDFQFDYLGVGECGTMIVPLATALPTQGDKIIISNVAFAADNYKTGVSAIVISIESDGCCVLQDMETGDLFTELLTLDNSSLNGTWGNWDDAFITKDGLHAARSGSFRAGQWVKFTEGGLEMVGRIRRSNSNSNSRLAAPRYLNVAVGGNAAMEREVRLTESNVEPASPLYEEEFNPSDDVITDWSRYETLSLSQIKREIYDFSVRMMRDDGNCSTGTDSFLYELGLPTTEQPPPTVDPNQKPARKQDITRLMRKARDYLANNRPVPRRNIKKYMDEFKMSKVGRKQTVVVNMRIEVPEGVNPTSEFFQNALGEYYLSSSIDMDVVKMTLRNAGSGAQ